MIINYFESHVMDRLTAQQAWIKKFAGGHALDPSIPKSNVFRVADVCTGTG